MSHNSGSYRDNQDIRVAREVASPKNQPQLSQTMMGQYWLPNKLLDQPEMLSWIDSAKSYTVHFIREYLQTIKIITLTVQHYTIVR